MTQKKCSNNKYYAYNFLYYELKIYLYFLNKFGFRIGAFNLEMFFPIM